MKPILFFLAGILLVASAIPANAQQYKLRQVTNMMSMKSESTIYVKGMRKRTETGGYMGMGSNIVTIEQCDLQRTVRLNDKKKLYIIDPFGTDNTEVIDEDVKPAAARKAVAKPTPEELKGGTITMWYNITDTGERKKMYGFTARHIWTTQKIKPSADACTMKDSMVIKTDGWYIDLPLFNCPINYTNTSAYKAYEQQMTCKDRYISKRSGKGKLGFPLIETRTIIMGDGSKTSSEYKTDLETLELTTVKLDSMLFEIPPGYKLASSEEELQSKPDYAEMMKQAGKSSQEYADKNSTTPGTKKAGVIRVGVLPPSSDGQLQPDALQQQLVNSINAGNIEAVRVNSAEEAKQLSCDLLLTTAITRIKQASKVGGLLKAIKNTDPSAASSYTIEGTLILTTIADGSTRLQEKINGKFEGKQDEAGRKAMEEGGRQVVNGLN